MRQINAKLASNLRGVDVPLPVPGFVFILIRLASLSYISPHETASWAVTCVIFVIVYDRLTLCAYDHLSSDYCWISLICQDMHR